MVHLRADGVFAKSFWCNLPIWWVAEVEAAVTVPLLAAATLLSERRLKSH